jgi:hypothetical protein
MNEKIMNVGKGDIYNVHTHGLYGPKDSPITKTEKD